jgi:1-acyl-sn-glycerol-3-phosphate acyltransferase
MHPSLTALRRFPLDLRSLLQVVTLGVLRGTLRRALAGPNAEPLVACDPALRDPDFLAPFMDALEVVAKRYFRWEVRGIEQVPRQGPALLVGNHNGGIVNTDSLLTLLAIWRHFGPERALYPLAHDLVYFDPVLSRIAPRMGVLRAGHSFAGRALDRGGLVLVYPGSDLDAWRPFRARHRIELGGRRGFLRLALRHRVPIVPVVSAGTHEQLVVLWRGDELVRRTGLKRLLGTEACPIVLSLPWGLTSGYLTYLPLPAQTTLQFGPPIHFDDVEPAAADDPATLDRCYERVRGEMQAGLDSLARGRRWLRGQERGRSPREA